LNATTIQNCYRDGYAITNDEADAQPNGIVNCLVLSCGWNGMTLGGGSPETVNAYALDNEVAYCSDVGITNYGVNTTISGNYVHDMNGTTNTQAHWGIGIEAGNATVTNNRVIRCHTGISEQACFNNFVQNNTLDCDTGIAFTYGGNNIGTVNNILNYSSGYNFGFLCYNETGNTILANNITGPAGSGDQAICLQGTWNTSITQNTVTSQNYGVLLETNSSYNLIQDNNLTAATGIRISGGTCVSNRIGNNAFVCSTNISDTGTNTLYGELIVTPSPSPTPSPTPTSSPTGGNGGPGNNPTPTPSPTPFTTPNPNLPTNGNVVLDGINLGNLQVNQTVVVGLNITFVASSFSVREVAFPAPLNSWVTPSSSLPQILWMGKGTVTYTLTVPATASAGFYAGSVQVMGVDPMGHVFTVSAPITLHVGESSTLALSDTNMWLLFAALGVIAAVVVAAVFVDRR
jgi:parallel beta-helix repeat protein